MKKWCIAFLMTILLALSMVLSVVAEGNAFFVDDANLLEDTEEAELEQILEEISMRQNCDVVIVTVDSLDGKSAMEYADDYFDYNGYGYGAEKDGILFLIAMEDCDWWISTHGSYGISSFTDAGIDYMSEQFLPSLSDGDYYEAFTTYANLCDEFLMSASEGEPYDVGNLPEDEKGPGFYVVAGGLGILVGFLISLIMAQAEKKKLKTIYMKKSAGQYESKNSLKLTRKKDTMVRTYVTTVVIPKNDDNSHSGGGSTTHVSSSGHSHGGGGGKF